MNEEWISDCCSADMDGTMADMGICPECLEHCEVVVRGE